MTISEKVMLQGRVAYFMLVTAEHCDSATHLAETTAARFDHDEWLDDETHWVWQMALDYYNAWMNREPGEQDDNNDQPQDNKTAQDSHSGG